MRLKAIVALVTDDKTERIIEVAREGGATGCTVVTNARGEGLRRPRTFLGLDLEGHRDMVVFLVEEHLSRQILEAIGIAGSFDESPGTGVAFQIDVEDAVGLSSQVETILHEIEDQI